MDRKLAICILRFARYTYKGKIRKQPRWFVYSLAATIASRAADFAANASDYAYSTAMHEVKDYFLRQMSTAITSHHARQHEEEFA